MSSSLRDNGDWACWCLCYGATAAVISANVKNFESTPSKMIKEKKKKLSKTQELKKIASGKPAGLILSLLLLS